MSEELTSRQRFKFAFLRACAERGMDLEQTLHVATQALRSKQAEGETGVVGSAVGAAKDTLLSPLTLGGKVISHGWPWALAIPPALGAVGGLALAKATDFNDESPEESKAQELIDEYRRYAERANYNTQLRRLKQTTPRRGRPLLV